MTDSKIKKIILAAMLAALCCVATLVIQIPSPMNGYVNLGDCIVLVSGFILGPLWGACAAGIGSALADVIAGYVYYFPGTLIIKALCAAVSAIIYKKSKKTALWCAVSGICGECIMVVGYFLYAALIFGEGLTAALSIPGNIVQAIAGIVVSVLIMQALKKFLK